MMLCLFFMLYQILFSPQVKRSVIIINKRDIHELSQEFPRNLRLQKHQDNRIIEQQSQNKGVLQYEKYQLDNKVVNY